MNAKGELRWRFKENIVIFNEWDEVLKKRGVIDEVRKIEVEALIDTGTVMVLIPQDMKEYLGLEDKGKVTPRLESPFLPTLKMK